MPSSGRSKSSSIRREPETGPFVAARAFLRLYYPLPVLPARYHPRPIIYIEILSQPLLHIQSCSIHITAFIDMTIFLLWPFLSSLTFAFNNVSQVFVVSELIINELHSQFHLTQLKLSNLTPVGSRLSLLTSSKSSLYRVRNSFERSIFPLRWGLLEEDSRCSRSINTCLFDVSPESKKGIPAKNSGTVRSRNIYRTG